MENSAYGGHAQLVPALPNRSLGFIRLLKHKFQTTHPSMCLEQRRKNSGGSLGKISLIENEAWYRKKFRDKESKIRDKSQFSKCIQMIVH